MSRLPYKVDDVLTTVSSLLRESQTRLFRCAIRGQVSSDDNTQIVFLLEDAARRLKENAAVLKGDDA